jgi:hypothetical protein
MTIRTEINKKTRKSMIIGYLGFAIFASSLIISNKADNILFITGIGFAIFLVSILYTLFGIKCIKCNKSIGYITNYSGNPFAISNKIQYCPFCGVNIDTE